MAVHGWPTALCELFQAQVMFEACAHARIRAYTHTRPWKTGTVATAPS